MSADELIARLDGVRPRGTGRWAARCPAHADKSPSLSISAGERGILLNCFAACTKSEIVSALGLTLADLFYDSPTSRGSRPTPKPPYVNLISRAFRFELAALDRRLRAERIIEAGHKLDVATMANDELDRALGLIVQAHVDVERAELFEHVADTLRERNFIERMTREQSRRVA